MWDTEIGMRYVLEIIGYFFDIGADKYYRLSDKQNLIEKIAIKENDVIFIIISHWDVDHYQSLLFFQNETCQKIAGIIAPEVIPHTNTARMVVNYIEQHHIKFFRISGFHKSSNKSSKEVELNCIYDSQYLKLYRSRSKKISSRNLDSIVLFVKGNNVDILFTGDQQYHKLYQYILSTNVHDKENKKLILIVPHHGGNSGKLKPDDWEKFNYEKIILSYSERNHYCHPKSAVMDNLKQIDKQNGENICETNGKNICENLKIF